MALARLASTIGRACRPAPQLVGRCLHVHAECATRSALGVRLPLDLGLVGESRSAGLLSNARSQWRRLYASDAPSGSQAAKSLTQGLANALARVPQAAYKVLPGEARTLVDASRRPGTFQRVVSLQLDSFWQRHARKVYVLAGVFAAYALWRTMYGITSTFINLSETMAAGGFLALSASIVILGALYLKRKYTIDPAVACRLAMTRLNTHPGVLEVMGAPLVSSPVRASVVTGGGLRFKGLAPKIRSRRAQIIFPLTGSERRGLVSIEAKKRKVCGLRSVGLGTPVYIVTCTVSWTARSGTVKSSVILVPLPHVVSPVPFTTQGQYVFKLIAVDVPTLSGDEQRIFIEGGPAIYSRGGILDELRDPFLRVRSRRRVF